MSTQNFHQGIFSFSNGYDRSAMTKHMVRGQVFEPLLPVVTAQEVSGELPLYETGGGMLSEMFAPAATAIFDNQIQNNYRWSQKLQNEAEMGGLGEQKHLNQDQFSNINSQLVNSLQLPTMNMMNTRVKPFSSPSSLQMLFSNPSNSHVQGGEEDSPVQFTWLHGNTGDDANNTNKIGGTVESHGLSLSLCSSLEAAKFEELRVGNGGIFFSNNQGGVGASLNFNGSKNLRSDRQLLDLEGIVDRHGQVHVGFGTSLEMVNVLRNSKFVKAAQELLEEICCVGRGELRFKNQRPKKHHHINPNSNTDRHSGSSSMKEQPTLSAADKSAYQRKKVKLLSMLDEVDGRYRHYCEKMQTMVNSFDSVMGFGAALTYTAMAQKAMSRHFKCIKNGIAMQLKLTCEMLGEKDVTAGGMSCLTKGETPRLRLIEQNLRQQKSLHMGMMELEAWRPQRGLPERSVNILRAWLFEHFLHPYPSDADKHLLSRQTGLSKNQVSNWFINARVRLWKPMVEDMYQKEAEEDQETVAKDAANSEDHPNTNSAQTPLHSTATTTTPPPSPPPRKNRSQNTIKHRHYSLGNEVMFQDTATTVTATTTNTFSTSCHDVIPSIYHSFSSTHDSTFRNWGATMEDMCRHESIVELGNFSTAGARLGSTPAGDVSLTLGLLHTGNVPEKNQHSIRNFGPL
ncbi:unnamed protein product [Camellia sinensis]